MSGKPNAALRVINRRILELKRRIREANRTSVQHLWMQTALDEALFLRTCVKRELADERKVKL